MMKRATLNYGVDAIAFILFVFLGTTGFLLEFQLPHGSGGLGHEGMGRGALQKPVTILWGLTRQEWGEIHFWVAVALLAVMAVHVWLHWRWIVQVTRGTKSEYSGRRLLLGAISLLILAALTLAVYFGPREEVTRGELIELRSGE